MGAGEGEGGDGVGVVRRSGVWSVGGSGMGREKGEAGRERRPKHTRYPRRRCICIANGVLLSCAFLRSVFLYITDRRADTDPDQHMSSQGKKPASISVQKGG